MTVRRRLADRLGLGATLPDFLQRGSEARRWLSLSVRSALTVFDVGFLVAGTGFVGIGFALMLNGFGMVNLAVDNSLGQALGVGLVIMMIGGFFIGIAAEGPIGHSGADARTKPWESLIAAVPALVVTVWLIGFVEQITDRLLVPYSTLFRFVSAHLNAVQQSGFTVALLVGIPAMWAVKQFLAPRIPFLGNAAPGVLYASWMIAIITTYQPII